MVKKSTVVSKKAHKNKDTFEPIKVGLAVAAAASACLVLFAVVAMYL